ncbi:MAG: hypothetical protein Q8S73_15125 [Deltaproteobacteria bacterium]|nr:hypothetical protein [Myxococcales bacterium]MDP3215439.1 hypothetical protein [Deltaproteobacteria bacterium]
MAHPPSTLPGRDDFDAARAPTLRVRPGCPRCAAERRARWSYSGTQATGTMAGVLLLVAFRLRRDDATSRPTIAILLGLTTALACLAWGLRHVTRRLDARASTPPPADPLAHYRAGSSAECPQHPFDGGDVEGPRSGAPSARC